MIISRNPRKQTGVYEQTLGRTMSHYHMSDTIQQFLRDGFVVVRGIISSEVIGHLACFVIDAERHYHQIWLHHTNVALDDVTAVREWLDRMLAEPGRFASLPDDLQHLARGEMPLPVRLDARLRIIAHTEPLTNLLLALLQCESIRQHNPPSIRVSRPGMYQGNVPLHQDWAYNRHMADFISVWVPLCSIDDACGGVDVFPGSHRLGRVDHQSEVIWGNAIHHSPFLAAFTKEHVIVEPGDVLIFSPELLHGSHANTSERTRLSIDYRFFDATKPSGKPAYDPKLRQVIWPP